MDCPFCDQTFSTSKSFGPHFAANPKTHPDYLTWKVGQRWAGKAEGVDFVRCLECGHQGATLARHLKAAHGITADDYRVKHPGALIRPSKITAKRQAAIKRGRKAGAYTGTKKVPCPFCGTPHEVHKLSSVVPCPKCKEAQKAAERAARPPRVSPLKGHKLPESTRRKMSKNAGRWNKGLTKDTDPRVASYAEKLQGQGSWNAGLSKGTDPRIAETARKLALYTGEARPWDNGLAANLTLEDFKPFMDEAGRVDHHKVTEATGVSWRTVRGYIVDLSLACSRKYIEEGAETRTVRIDKEVLEGFLLKNGKVSVGKAVSVLGHTFSTIKRECERHGLPTFNRRIRQTICMEAVSEALGGLPYRMEWKSWKFTNPPTGHRFRFDALFPDVGLIVEFHGHQHYTFPNAFMVDESYEGEWEALVERDRLKREMIEAAPDLLYFEVHEDEPYTDAMYLRGRLRALGL